MEQLKELEQVQNIMSMIQSAGVIDSSNNTNADSNRFLANFILFMMQPCGELDMNQKCKLISDYFPKISSAFGNEALHQLCDKGENACAEDSVSHQCDDDKSVGLLKSDCEDVAMVTFDSMQRENSTLQDFCRSYFMFHEMDANSAESIFKYLPLLSFTESYIYQLDTINEKLLQLPSGGISDADMTPDWVLRFIKSFKTDTFRPLAVLLESHGIHTDRIRDELKCGEEYWALERKLCSALTNKQGIQVEDVMRAINLKSFDYRVLNLLLYQLNCKEVNETHMEFLSVSEFLVEVSDDFSFIYSETCCFLHEENIKKNAMSAVGLTMRMMCWRTISISCACLPEYMELPQHRLCLFHPFQKHFANQTPLESKSFKFQAKTITEAEEKYNCLLNTLDPQLSFKYQKRCEEATKEGGKVFGPPLGTWSIPPIIEDEDLYRYEISKNGPSTNLV